MNNRNGRSTWENSKIFGLSEWESWFNRMANSVFKVSGVEFEAGYRRGDYAGSASASDLASILPLIRQLRHRRDTEGAASTLRV